ncbi:hypothetical protein ILUMI_07751 [Ignelater luminosus]|uniref:Uncharacterized protein n=1 Tax=Ignelater luminosus TaxID=2038154 RepID=A0A8K0GGJ7_IGNLU|nr:hypothetical protein ILUMI_07751 [Ignelater luminosus]
MEEELGTVERGLPNLTAAGRELQYGKHVFWEGKRLKFLKPVPVKEDIGRPDNYEIAKSFQKNCDYIKESNDCQFSVEELLFVFDKKDLEEYNEILAYEAASTKQGPPAINEGTFAQFVINNADINLSTIDGHGTFHCMRGIECVTPTESVERCFSMERSKSKLSQKSDNLVQKIEIIYFHRDNTPGLKSIQVEDFNVTRPISETFWIMTPSDILWLLGKWLNVPLLLSWNEFMEKVTKNIPYDKRRGVTDNVISKWIHESPASCEAAENFEKFCGIKSATSHQHIQLGKLRMKTDDSDVKKFLEWFQQHPSFIVRNELMSLSSGIIGDESINCYKSMEIGKNAMTSMASNNNFKVVIMSRKSGKMKEKSMTILQAPHDADSLIVNTTILYATTNPSVIIVKKNVDVMVLMVALTPEDKDTYLLKPGKGKNKNVIYSSAAEQKRHSSITNHLLFLHAANGCDTTSEEKIAQAREELTRVLYKGEKGESIDRLKYVGFTQASARDKIHVKLESLPLKSGAAKMHFLRVYHQVQSCCSNATDAVLDDNDNHSEIDLYLKDYSVE